MRKHGWQLPHHPLQVVAVTVFLALGFAFYVFFVPFVGRRVFQYAVMGVYTPLITCVFCLYIWCAAANPCDPGVFKSKKYLNTVESGKHSMVKESKLGREPISSTDANAAKFGENPLHEGMNAIREDPVREIEKNTSFQHSSFCMIFLWLCPAFIRNCSRQHEESSEQQMSEDGMFYCSLCKVEVFKYSKHCRVCDKCVNHFDHHCRWLNNCIGKKNYRQFFALMVSALFLLVLQWSIGILVMIFCFLDRRQFTVEITSNLGSRFSLVPFVVVVASCTILAMISTLPIAQLFFFHVLLIKKGITTYDYIIALREQEQQGLVGQQSPQMSLSSSRTGLSSTSSFNTFHRGPWCTPPRMFLEDQFDVVPPDIGMSISSSGKRMLGDEPVRKKNTGAVKISPWALARLNAEEVSKVAAQARKKSKIMQPVVRRELPFELETDCSSSQITPRPESQRYQPVRLPTDLPLEPMTKISVEAADSRGNLLAEMSNSLAPLQLEARSAFHTSRAMSASATIVDSSPDSSVDSFNPHPFRVSSSRAEEARVLVALSAHGSAAQRQIPLLRSNSDGYEASGGEDSDQVSSRTMYRSTNWSNLVYGSDHDNRMAEYNAPSSSSQANSRRL